MTMIEGESEKEVKQGKNNHLGDEIEIDLMDILRKIIAIRKTIYKAVGIGLVIGIIIALSIPKQYTVTVIEVIDVFLSTEAVIIFFKVSIFFDSFLDSSIVP